MPSSLTSPTTWNLPLDTLLDRLAFPNFTHRLPFPLAHLLGHRTHPDRPTGNVPTAISALLGAFLAILTVGALYMTPTISSHHPPLVLGSLGAASILHFSTPLSPVAQPRNAILGTLLSTTIAVALSKALLPPFPIALSRPPPSLPIILTAALATGLSSAAMVLTGTTYPPAGATALLAVVDPPTRGLAWYVLGLGVLGAGVCVVEGCVVINAGRRYPAWWWSSRGEGDVGGGGDVGDVRKVGRWRDRRRGGEEGGEGRDLEKGEERGGSDGSAGSEVEGEEVFAVIFTRDRIYLPSVRHVAGEKTGVLRMLKERLEGEGGQGPEIDSSLWDSRSEESIRELMAEKQGDRSGRA